MPQAVAQGLSQHGFGVVHSDQVEGIPGAVGKDDAMNVRAILDRVEEVVVGILRRTSGQGREDGFGLVPVHVVHGFFAADRRALFQGESSAGMTGSSFVRFFVRPCCESGRCCGRAP